MHEPSQLKGLNVVLSATETSVAGARMAYPDVDWKDCEVIKLVQVKDYYKRVTGKEFFACVVCGGALHEPLECPTKKALDACAKRSSQEEALRWGAWKYHHYYKGLKTKVEFQSGAMQTRALKQGALSAVLGKRSFSSSHKKRKFFPGKSFVY